jgi:hypothetical protein
MTGTVPWAGEPTPANQGRLMMLDWHDQLLPAQDPHSGYPGFGVGPGLWFADRMANRYLTLAPLRICSGGFLGLRSMILSHSTPERFLVALASRTTRSIGLAPLQRLPDHFVFIRAGEMSQEPFGDLIINERRKRTDVCSPPSVQLDQVMAMVEASLE